MHHLLTKHIMNAYRGQKFKKGSTNDYTQESAFLHSAIRDSQINFSAIVMLSALKISSSSSNNLIVQIIRVRDISHVYHRSVSHLN